jgi:hypothetical protein
MLFFNSSSMVAKAKARLRKIGLAIVSAGGGAYKVVRLGRAAKAAEEAAEAEEAGGAAATSASIGAAREADVAQMTGGQVVRAPIVEPGVGRSEIDVIAGNGDYIQVGGPAKAKKLAELGHDLRVLKYAADQNNVAAKAYFVEGTPDSVLSVARRILGADNVITFLGGI